MRPSAPLAALALALPLLSLPARATEYVFDPSHTKATFKVRHMMFAWVYGSFGAVTGAIDYDAKNPSAMKVDARVDTTTVNTGIERRDAHLRSPDFFDVKAFPQLSFSSKKAEMQPDGHVRLAGDLTIRGVTHEAIFDLEPIQTGRTPWGTDAFGTTAIAKINRHDWGLNWNRALEAGGVLVGDEVTIELSVEVTPKLVSAK